MTLYKHQPIFYCEDLKNHESIILSYSDFVQETTILSKNHLNSYLLLNNIRPWHSYNRFFSQNTFQEMTYPLAWSVPNDRFSPLLLPCPSLEGQLRFVPSPESLGCSVPDITFSSGTSLLREANPSPLLP